MLDDNGIRPPLIAAGINLFGGPLGLIHRHVTGAIPIRRNTKDPAYLITLKAYVAEMLQEARPVLLSGRRPQLQRRAEAGEDRAASRRADGRTCPTWSSCRPRSPTTSCSRITSSRGSASRSSSGRSRRELAEMVRYAVGYRSRAFVTFGAPIPVGDRDVRLAQRRARAGAARPRRASARLYKVLPTAVFAAAMRPSITRRDLESAHRPADRRARGAPAPTSASPAGAQAVDEAAEPLETRGIIVAERGRFRVRERSVLRYYARTIEHLLVDARPDALMRRCSASKAFFHLARAERHAQDAWRRATACASRRASRAGSSPARPSTKRSTRRAPSRRAACCITLDYLGESVTTLDEADAGDARLPARSSTRSSRPASSATSR